MSLLPISWKGMKLSKTLVSTLLQKAPPPKRSSKCSLAVVIPVRDRDDHLKQLLPLLLPQLEKACASYHVFIVKQDDQAPFNKGALFNAAVSEIGDRYDYLCFHDVDFCPETVDYRFCSYPLRPFSFTRGNKTYETQICQKRLDFLLAQSFLPTKMRLASVYDHFWGGVVLVPTATFKKANGFSNAFPGWGFEDLDFLIRLFAIGETPYADSQGIFSLLPHKNSAKSYEKALLEKNLERYMTLSKKGNFNEGFSTVSYDLTSIQNQDTTTVLSLCQLRQKS